MSFPRLVIDNSSHANGAPGPPSAGVRQVPVGDVSSRRSSQGDPTGTLMIRKDLSRALDKGWRLVKASITRTVGQDDSFALARGMEGLGPRQFQTLASGGGQLEVFNNWLGNLQDRVFETQHNVLERAVQQGYMLGAIQAEARVGKPLPGRLPGPAVVVASAIQDLNGITAAALQQSSRVFSYIVLQKRKPRIAARGVNLILDSVGASRTNLLASYAVVRAYAEGSLDAYQALGVTHVGTIPETLPGQSLRKSARTVDAPVELGKLKLKVVKPPRKPRTTRPPTTPRARARIRARLVNVVTAGDDRVCPVCIKISEAGPYTISQARGLIPAHSKCRCGFEPADAED